MKKKELFVSAIIVAAGNGKRMNSSISKPYIEIDGNAILAITLSLFEKIEIINEIIVVLNFNDFNYFKTEILGKYNFSKLKQIVAGGTERQYSVLNGLLEVDKSSDIVLIHDGVRSFTSEKIILDSIDAAVQFEAAICAVPVKDTIKSVDSNQFVAETLDRSKLWSVQTPQTFDYELILNAHMKAKEDNFIGTDDGVLVERLGVKTKIVMGDYNNIKITTQEDLEHAKAILSKI